MAMRKLINKLRYLLLTKTELKLICMSAVITEEYIKSRTFRRMIDKTPIGDYIKQTLNNWDNEAKGDKN